MGFAAAGYLQPVVGAITQEIIDIAAILNALRMVLPSEDLKEV
jgi:cation transport ATPase